MTFLTVLLVFVFCFVLDSSLRNAFKTAVCGLLTLDNSDERVTLYYAYTPRWTGTGFHDVYKNRSN